MNRIALWLEDHFPVRCAKCGRWVFAKDARGTWMTTGQRAHMCLPCWIDTFQPWRGKDD